MLSLFAHSPQKVDYIHRETCFAYFVLSVLVKKPAILSLDSRERHYCSINLVTKEIKTESTRKMSNFNFQ